MKLDKIRVITKNQYEDFKELTDRAVERIPIRYTRKRFLKQYRYMLNQIETITDFSEDFTEGKRYSILSYVDVNLGHNPYNFYAKQLVKLDNIIFMGQTNQFFKTNKGRIAKKKVLAVFIDWFYYTILVASCRKFVATRYEMIFEMIKQNATISAFSSILQNDIQRQNTI